MFVKLCAFRVLFQTVSWAMNEAKTGLGIDAGGSSSRWLLISDTGTVLGEGRSGPLTGHIFSADEQDEQLGRFVEMLTAARAVHTPGRARRRNYRLASGNARRRAFQTRGSGDFGFSGAAGGA